MAKKKKSKITASKNTSSSPKVTKRKFTLPAFFRNVKMNCLFIFLFSFLLYGMTLQYGYTQDDAIVITDNMYTTQGVKGIPGIFKKDTFHGFFKKDGKEFLVGGGRYRPLTLAMFAMEWEIYPDKYKDKEKDNPVFYHFFTVALYGLTGIVLYLLLLKMLRPTKGEDFAFFVALVSTVIFIAHPIHTEVVANIKGRDEIVALLGSMAALYFSLKAFYSQKENYNKTIQYSIIAGVIFFLALMAKENAITFCAVVPLTFFVFTKAKPAEIIAQSGIFLGAAVLFMIIRTSVIKFDLGSTECNELMNCPYLKVENGQYVAYTSGEKFATIFYTLGQYIKLLFFPHPLTHDYYPYHVGTMNFGDWRVLLSLFTYIGLGIYSIIGILKKDIVAFGIAFYIITLSIVSNLLFPVGTNMAERFAFMPSVGFSLIMGVLAFRLWKFLGKNDKAKSASHLSTVLGIVGVVVILFSTKTFLRNPAFKDNYTLFTTDVQVSKNSAKVQNSTGGETIKKAESLKEGDPERLRLLNKAVGHLNEAKRLHPTYKNAYLLLGNAHQYLNKFDEAVQYYLYALQLDPGFSDAENNLTLAYRNGGKYFGEKLKNNQKALQFLTAAFQRDQNDIETLRLLGIVYSLNNNSAKAIETLEKALQLQPNNSSIMFNLGVVLDKAGFKERAAQYIQKAREIDPNIGNQ